MNSLIYAIISLGGLGLIFGLILGYSSKKFHVEVDERVPLVRECLPGANCGGCGFAGCDAYAQAVVDGKAEPNCCTVAGSTAAEKIAKIMGSNVSIVEPKVARVKCKGTCDKSKQKGIYYGSQSCLDAVNIPGSGQKSCEYGCLGFGSCVSACKFDAIHVVNGVAVVDDKLCVGCGACVNICPKNLIELLPASQKIYVSCNSHDRGMEVKRNCSAGCIGCTLCAKNCPKDAITMVNNLPVIDPEKCVQCGICVQKCPTKVITSLKKKPIPSINE